MTPETKTKRVRAFWGRVVLIESPVDESQTRSGIIVPDALESDVKRGVVDHVDTTWDDDSQREDVSEQLAPGTVVYYRGGTKILDTVVVERASIIATESPE